MTIPSLRKKRHLGKTRMTTLRQTKEISENQVESFQPLPTIMLLGKVP